MMLIDALAIIQVHGHGHYLSREKENLLHEARKVVVERVREIEKERLDK